MAPHLFDSVALICLATSNLASPLVVGRGQASPGVVEIPVTATIGSNTSTADIVAFDQARLDRYFARVSTHEKRQIVVPVNNTLGSYTASVGVGANGKKFQLVVDTGSSNTWVGARGGYVKTSTSTDTGRTVEVGYGSGSVSGEEYTDQVTLGVTVTNQGIGVASSSSGFDGVDGIVGFGPEDLTAGTVSGSPNVPTFLQTALAQGKIAANILGVYFSPTTTSGTVNGRLTLGGINDYLYTGSITYGPVTSTHPANQYWGISVTFTAGGPSISSTIAGIVDTGTTLVHLPSDVAASYYAGSGFAYDQTTQLYRSRSSGGLKPLGVTFVGRTFTWAASDILVPSGDYEAFGLEAGYYYSWIGNTGSRSGAGLDFTLGQKFLEHFYSVYDTDNHRVGLATTSNP